MHHRPRAERRPSRRIGGRWRARPAVLASLVVVVGLLFAQLVQLSDLLLFQHTACQHGELVHGPARASAKAEAAHEEDGHQHLGAAPADDHEHCEALAIRHRASSVALYVPEATILGWADAPLLVLGSPQRPIALLDVAPKASPPRG